VTIDGVKKCEGDASVVMIRGKPRHGFDFETTLTWTAVFPSEDEEADKEDGSDDDEDDDGGIEIKGTIHVPEASRECAEDEECQFEIKLEDRKAERRDKEDACYAAVKKGAEDFLVDILKTIDTELAERAKA
jgi:activator of HSP90 ATPase